MRKTTSLTPALTALAICALLIPAAATAQTGVMFVTDNKVGIGTATPDEALHVAGATAKIKVTNTAGAVANRELFDIQNNGRAQFSFRDTTQTATWKFTTRDNGIEIRKEFAPAPSIKVEESGKIRMGPGTTQVFDLQTNGDLFLDGTLFQGSSRHIKQGFAPVDGRAVLQQVSALPLAEWSYKSAPKWRHVGPMAEDFHAAFGFGSDSKTLAPSDVASVALAAIQGLNGLLQEKDNDIAALQQENQDLTARIAALERAVLGN